MPKVLKYANNLKFQSFYAMDSHASDISTYDPPLDANMAAAVSSGYTAASSNDIANGSFICPSGNCSYPIYDTLGVCSKCVDLSDMLRYVERDFYSTYEYGNVMLANGHYENLTGINWNMTHPTNSSSSGLGRPPGPLRVALMNVTATTLNEAWISEEDGIEGDDGLFINQTWLPISNFTSKEPNMIVTLAMVNATNFDSWPGADLSAKECSLSFCIQSMNTSVSNGILTQEVVERPYTVSADNSSVILTTAEADPSYDVDGSTFHVLAAHLIRFFLGTGIQDGIESAYPDPVVIYHTSTPIEQISSGDGQIEMLYNSTNVTLIFENIARAMTIDLLENYAENYTSGQMGRTVTTVQVRWGWIALPVGVTLLGAIFLVVLARITHDLKLPLWKTSLLPVLLHGSEHDAEVSRTSSLINNVRMGDYAGRVRVSLHPLPSDGGLVLRKLSEMEQGTEAVLRK